MRQYLILHNLIDFKIIIIIYLLVSHKFLLINCCYNILVLLIFTGVAGPAAMLANICGLYSSMFAS